MGADGDHIRPKGGGGKADFAEGLHRIRMGDGVGGHRPDRGEGGFHIVQRAAFVIDQHEAGQDGAVGVVADEVHIEGAAPGRHTADGEPVGLQPFHAFLHGGMLAVRGEDLTPAAAPLGTPLGVDRSQNGQLIRLGTAGGKEDLPLRFPTDAQGTGHVPAAFLQNGTGADARGMDGGGIAPRLGEDVGDFFDDGGVGCCGGAVIKIDRIHYFQRKLSRMALISSV